MGAARPYASEHVRRGIRAFVEGHVIAGAIGILVALALVRTMAPEQYAVYATVPALVVLLVELTGFGLPLAVARYVPEQRLHGTPASLARLVWRLLGWRLALVGAAVALLLPFNEAIARLLHLQHAERALLAGYAYLVAYAAFSHLQKTLEALVAQNALKRGMLIEWIPKAAIILLWIGIAGAVDAEQALAVHAATSAAGALAMAILLARHLAALGAAGGERGAGKAPRAGALFGCARDQWLQTLLVMPSDAQGLRVVAAALLAPGAMAAFGFQQIFVSLVARYAPIQLFIGMIDSLVSARWVASGRFESVSDVSATLLKVNAFVLVPVLAGSLVVAEPLTLAVTGGRYGESAWLMPVLLGSVLAESFWFVARAGANAVDRTGVLVRAGAIALAVLAALVVLAVIDVLPALAAIALACLAAPAARAAYVMAVLARDGFVYRFDWSGFVSIALGSGVAVAAGAALGSGAAAAFPTSTFAPLAATIAGAAIVYLALARARPPFNARERELLGRITGRFRFPG